jgi:hypothetical protein
MSLVSLFSFLFFQDKTNTKEEYPFCSASKFQVISLQRYEETKQRRIGNYQEEEREEEYHQKREKKIEKKTWPCN